VCQKLLAATNFDGVVPKKLNGAFWGRIVGLVSEFHAQVMCSKTDVCCNCCFLKIRVAVYNGVILHSEITVY